MSSGASADETERALKALLSESIEEARLREQTTFTAAAGDRSDRIVLFGAGGLGKRTLTGLRAAGIEPLALADNREALWGTEIDGVKVLAPADAAEQFGSTAAFVVTIWGAGSPHRLEHSMRQLRDLGCDLVLAPAWLFWRFPQELLPFYALDLPSHVLEQADEIRQCLHLFADDQSKQQYVSQVQWRLSGDPGCLSPPVAEEQYLVSDVAKPHDREIVLDCGAYDGDTLRSWLDVRGPSFATYFAMEPDPQSRARLEDSLQEMDPEVAKRVRVLPYSVAGYTGTATFSASGSLSSAMGAEDGITVQCITLNDLEAELGGEDPTFLKMDVEGAELDALAGGMAFLGRTHPMLTIASYHVQNHLWRVPLTIHGLWSGYQLYLRPHNEEGWDLILYAVPGERALLSA